MQILISNIDQLCEHFSETDAQSIYNNLPGTYTHVSGEKVTVSISKGIASFHVSGQNAPVKERKKRGTKKGEKPTE